MKVLITTRLQNRKIKSKKIRLPYNKCLFKVFGSTFGHNHFGLARKLCDFS